MTHLCPYCFHNSILRRRITELRRNRRLSNCTFHSSRKGVPISEVAALIDVVLRSNYEFAFCGHEDAVGRSLKDLLYDVTEAVDDHVIQALSNALIESEEIDERDGDVSFYGEDQNYSLVEPTGWHQSELWEEFRHAIMYSQRFFNGDAKTLLEELFDKVHFQTDADKQPAFYAIETGTMVHRARQARTIEEAKKLSIDPAKQLGPPPPELRKPGRMNAAGIGAFYGGLDEATCLAELRPPVGSLVCLASFRLRRSVYVLDFTRFENPGRDIDLFSKNYVARTTQWAFMQTFQQEISRPILPNDVHLEYVPTQVVAEYLAGLPVSLGKTRRRIEGLVFRSAQRPEGRNLVLFGDAGLIVGGHTPSARTARFDFDFGHIPSLPSLAPAAPALEYVADSIRLRSITSAQFGCEEEYLPPENRPDF